MTCGSTHDADDHSAIMLIERGATLERF
jgi:hypothetical protein